MIFPCHELMTGTNYLRNIVDFYPVIKSRLDGFERYTLLQLQATEFDVDSMDETSASVIQEI